MNSFLPEGCEFVDEGCIDNSSYERLFDDVVRHSEVGKFRPEAYVDEPDTDDTQRFELGVIEKEESDRLIAYASATMRDGHATIDMFVVRPLDRERGIGMAMAAKGVELLEKVGAKAISFVVEHDSIDLMVPGLVNLHGFTYDEREGEYIRRTEDDNTLFVPLDFALMPSDRESASDNQEPIDRSQRIAFKKRVSGLLSAAIEHSGPGEVPEGFSFKDGVNIYHLEESVATSGKIEWIVRPSGDEQATATPEGMRMVTGQTYKVIEPPDEDEPTESRYSECRNDLTDSDELEHYYEEIFTEKRFETIMRQLSRLTVANLEEPIDVYSVL